MTKKNLNSSNHKKQRSGEPEWIDLEKSTLEELETEPDAAEEEEGTGSVSRKQASTGKPASQRTPGKSSHKKKKKQINFQVILLALIAIVFVTIAFKLLFWDKRVRQNTERENDTTLSFDTEPLDSIVPLDSSNASKKEKDDDLHILFLGNGSLADDKDSDNNIANIVQKKTGATVYNCAISGSYMSMKNDTYKNDFIYDAFSFYNLCTIFTIDNTKTISWAERDLGGLPDDVEESLELLQSIDYNELDVLCIYYDGSDYLEQRPSYNIDKETDPTLFCGALSAGLDLIQQFLPQVRIIVMSPTYVYAVDEDGNYTSSFTTEVLEEPMSNYIGLQSQTCMDHHVTFVDNFYGSVYEEIADDYLKDNILLNEKGHALLADRFLYALNRFNDYDF